MTRHSRIDTTASAIITDADTFPPESTTPSKDDQRQGIYPLRVYEGYNYLPTAYGYKSYFGTQAELDATGLEGPAGEQFVVEEVFVYQTRAFVNVLVALTSHGIYLRSATEWEQVVPLDAPDENASLPWTVATLSNVIFIYRQGHSEVYVLDDLVDGTGVLMDSFNGMAVQPTRVDTSTTQPVHVYSFVPTMLNMAGQIGIYRAGGSLGFWDSDDSISWSAINDFTDFEPSLTTLANTTKLQDQIGAITTIQPHGDGFIVYCTRSVLYAMEDHSALLRYRTSVVLGNVGVAYPREVAVAEPDSTHYAFTSAGLMEISNGRAQPIVPDFSDYVKRTRLPQYMKMLNNRYLCIETMDPNFIPGNVAYSTGSIDPEDYKYDGSEVGGIDIPGEVIEGREVCFTNPTETKEGDEDVLDSGVKPYHLLQFYTQFLYTGAQFSFTRKQFGDEVVTSIGVRSGEVKPRYDVIPVSLTANEVLAFNDTIQVDQLLQRQRDAYAAAYDPVDFQSIWDEFVAAAPSVGSSYEISRMVTVNSLPSPRNKAEGIVGSAEYPDAFAWLSSEEQNAGNVVFGSDGQLYLAHPNSGASGFTGLIDSDKFVEQFPSLAHIVKKDGSTNYLVAVGKTTDIPHTAYSPETEAFVAYVRTESDSEPYPYSPAAAEFSEPSEDDVIRAVHPDAVKNIAVYAMEAGKLAFKLAAPEVLALEYKKQERSTPLTVLRPVPISSTYGFTNIEFVTYTLRPWGLHAAEPLFIGRIRGFDSDGNVIETQDIEEALVPPSTTEVAGTISIPLTVDQTEAAALYAQGVQGIGDSFTTGVWGPLLQQYASIRVAAESEMSNRPNVASVRWAWRSSIYDPHNVLGAENGLNAEYTVPYRGQTYATDCVYGGVELTETRLHEEQADYTKEFYGELPFTLPTTSSNAAAFNAMTDEQKAGLVTVFQHFYNRNNSRDVLDSSFLITAAGREEVPLGAPLGTVPEVIEEADFANRWFEVAYAGDLGKAGHGASLSVPGQTEGEMRTAEQGLVCGISEDIVINDYVRAPIVYPPWEIEVPELTWVLQNGSRAPFDPTLHGAYVFDLHLQKWGVFKGEYKHLIDYQPVNNYTPGSVPYKNFMIDGGCLTPDLEVALFNDYPAENVLRYGKYQHVGSEVCAVEQVHAEFAERSTGLVAVQFSLDGRRLEYGHSVAQWYNDALSTTLNCDIVGQWATISFTGHFDLAGLRVKSNPSGRR